MTCNQCRTYNEDGATFCGKCGAKLEPPKYANERLWKYGVGLVVLIAALFLFRIWFFSRYPNTYSNGNNGGTSAGAEIKADLTLPKNLEAYQAPLRDGQRLNDIRQIALNEELYFNNNNGYAKSLSDLVPKYMGAVPKAPTPPDGNCSEADNTYIYKFIDINNYTLNFCLGQSTSNYSAGKHVLTPQGVE